MQGQVDFLQEAEAVALPIIKKYAWQLFDEHSDMEVYTFKKWFIQKTIYLRDLKPLFEFLFGSDPNEPSSSGVVPPPAVVALS